MSNEEIITRLSNDIERLTNAVSQSNQNNSRPLSDIMGFVAVVVSVVGGGGSYILNEYKTNETLTQIQKHAEKLERNELDHTAFKNIVEITKNHLTKFQEEEKQRLLNENNTKHEIDQIKKDIERLNSSINTIIKALDDISERLRNVNNDIGSAILEHETFKHSENKKR